MSNSEVVQFYTGRKKDSKEKIELVQSWIKTKDNQWCFTCIDRKKDIFSIHGTADGDNDRISLVVILELMKWIASDTKKTLIVYTNSSYAVNCISEWMNRWKRNDFKIEDRDRPNADILRDIELLKINIDISMKLLMTDNEFSNKTYSYISE